jgi:hypothetical protein
MRNHSAWILITFAGAWTSVQAQWLTYPAPGIPRTKEGKPELSAPAPRVANGKPGLSGIWEAEPASREELSRFFPDGINLLGEDSPSRYFVSILSDFKPEEAPLNSLTKSIIQERGFGRRTDAPYSHCLPFGVPLLDLAPFPFKIIQTPGVIVFLYEADGTFRQIHTDGRKLAVDPTPTWMGYSTGRWEGDVLVVDSSGFNDRSWLDAFGHPHTEALRVTERFHRRDTGHMEVQITIDDPKSYSKPFTIKANHRLLADTDVMETVCLENEKDAQHLVGAH